MDDGFFNKTFNDLRLFVCATMVGFSVYGIYNTWPNTAVKVASNESEFRVGVKNVDEVFRKCSIFLQNISAIVS